MNVGTRKARAADARSRTRPVAHQPRPTDGFQDVPNSSYRSARSDASRCTDRPNACRHSAKPLTRDSSWSPRLVERIQSCPTSVPSGQGALTGNAPAGGERPDRGVRPVAVVRQLGPRLIEHEPVAVRPIRPDGVERPSAARTEPVVQRRPASGSSTRATARCRRRSCWRRIPCAARTRATRVRPPNVDCDRAAVVTKSRSYMKPPRALRRGRQHVAGAAVRRSPLRAAAGEPVGPTEQRSRWTPRRAG